MDNNINCNCRKDTLNTGSNYSTLSQSLESRWRHSVTSRVTRLTSKLFMTFYLIFNYIVLHVPMLRKEPQLNI